MEKLNEESKQLYYHLKYGSHYSVTKGTQASSTTNNLMSKDGGSGIEGNIQA